MTTTHQASALAPAAELQPSTKPTGHLTFAKVVRSEWIKMVTLKTTWAMLAAIAVSIAGFAVLAGFSASGATSTGPGRRGEDPVSTVMTGTILGLLLVGTAGALHGSREYASGLIRVTFTAVPSRVQVLAAKILVFTALTGVVVLVSTLVAFFAGMAVLSNGGAATLAWSDDGVARAVLGTVAYLTGLGVVGVALGVMLRNIGGSIAALIGGVIFLPTLASALLPQSWDGVFKYLPSNAAKSFTEVDPTASGILLDTTTGALVFATWVVIAVAGAVVLLRTRDA